MAEDNDQRILTVVEQTLNPQIDYFRDRLRAGYAKEAEKGLRNMLATLPGETSSYIVFRIKANIGQCLLQLSDISGALLWLDDAVRTAPREPKAIATQALILILRKEVREAIAFAQSELTLDPNNEELAAHLVDACINLNDGTDPDTLIPSGLKNRERVLLARCLLAQQRDQLDHWWSLARLGARTYPENHFFKIFSATADVDEIIRATRHSQYRALTEFERDKLRSSANILEEVWLRIKESEVPNREDGLWALSTGAVAYRLLEDGPKAIELAREFIDRSDYEPALLLAVQIALTFNDDKLVERGLEKLPPEGPAGFIKGVFEFNKGNWSEAAAILSNAEIPDSEKSHVAQLQHLATLSRSQDHRDEFAIDSVRQGALRDARTLISIANLARRRGFADLASRAYTDAVALLAGGASYPDRITVAAYAHFLEDYSTVIRALDGYLDEGAITPELLQLSDAHALERPTRRRNIKFYERLAPPIRHHLRIARSYASVLTQLHRYGEAESVLKHAINAYPKDAFIRLKLTEIYERTDRKSEVRKLVTESDETSFAGPPVYAMQWANLLRDNGKFSRALSLAYETLRTHPDDPQLALGYVRLIFGDRSQSIIPNTTEVDQDCWVLIKDDQGHTDSFIIGDGPAVFGIEVVSASQERAKRLIGKKVNDSFETSDLSGLLHIWTVTEIKSKYLHVLHTVTQSYERRFPSVPGLWGFTVVEGNIQPILDMIRARAESQRKAVEDVYLKGLPLAITARFTGMDVIGFAYFIRSLGMDVITAGGTIEECDQGISNARDYRDAGAVLDEYTAIVAAEIGFLPLLKSWFGSLSVPASVIDALDAEIIRARADLGTTQVSIGFVRGEFIRRELDDDFREQQINALTGIKEKIEAHCVVEPVAFPDALPQEIADLYRITGQRVLEPMFLAASRGDVLVSDDRNYRQISSVFTKVDGTWLQAVLLAARFEGLVNPKEETHIAVGLAGHRHGNLWLDAPSLALFSDEATDDGFAALCHFVGNKGADLRSHCLVTAQFLEILWSQKKHPIERGSRASCIISALIRHRTTDWATWIAFVWLYSDGAIRKYILGWLRGHFLPTRPVSYAILNLSRLQASRAIAQSANRQDLFRYQNN